MGFLNKLFKEDEETGKKPEEKKTEGTEKPMENIPPIKVEEQKRDSGEIVLANQDIINSLWQTIFDSNLPGPDYLELKSGAKGLEDFIPSEEQRLKAAFKVLVQSNPNLNKEIILSSINTYKDLIEAEKIQGLLELTDKRKYGVGEKELKLKSLKSKSEELQKQIQGLQEELEKISGESGRLSSEIMIDNSELDRKEKSFNLSIDAVLKTLENDKEKINKSIE